jgi:hypothetical protein
MDKEKSNGFQEMTFSGLIATSVRQPSLTPF